MHQSENRQDFFFIFRQEEGEASQQGPIHQQDVPPRRLRHPRSQKPAGHQMSRPTPLELSTLKHFVSRFFVAFFRF